MENEEKWLDLALAIFKKQVNQGSSLRTAATLAVTTVRVFREEWVRYTNATKT